MNIVRRVNMSSSGKRSYSLLLVFVGLFGGDLLEIKNRE